MKNGLAFGLGVLVGGGGAIVLANIILKQQYAQKADEEIAACREAFLAESAKRRKEQQEKEEAQKKKAAEAIKAYSPDPEKGEKAAQVIWKAPAKEEKTKSWKAPYVIDPALFDAADNPNKTLGLKYYPNDGVIAAADTDEPMSMEDLDAAVGREALLHFGEYGEDDRVCVRNENWGVDYEICIQGRPWAEVLKEKPWLKK